MQLNFAVYNVEWMKRLFDPDGNVKETGDEAERSAALARVFEVIDADVIGIVEGPDTTASGTRLSTTQLENWVAHHGLPANYRAVHGFTSGGQQELCALYKSDVVDVTHVPTKAAAKHPFDQPFLVDTTDNLIKEHYAHFRPPLELSIREPGGGEELARAIVAHAKSKGIFDKVDMARFVQLSERNRKKLYAECLSIRERADQWLEDEPGRPVIVAGDINDGFGMDTYEQKFAKSAVDLLLGDVWQPEGILKHVLPKPTAGRYGWSPNTSRFTDKGTGDTVNVLIDHILVSRDVPVVDVRLWNPFYDHKDEAKNAEVTGVKDELLSASDHFPISAVFDL